MLQAIEKSGVTLKLAKCEFGCSSVKFLGHVVSGEGISPDPDKVKAIKDMSPPTCKKEARRFMGMVNYLGKFSSNLAKYSSPIYAISGSASEWYWGPDQQSAFNSIKTELLTF